MAALAAGSESFRNFSIRFAYEDLIHFLHQLNAWQPFGFGMRACIVGLSLCIL